MKCKSCDEDIDIDEVEVIVVSDDGTVEIGFTCYACNATYSAWIPVSQWNWNEEDD